MRNLDQRTILEGEEPELDLASEAGEEVDQALLGSSQPGNGIEKENPHLDATES
jgi:hypothetical protein